MRYDSQSNLRALLGMTLLELVLVLAILVILAGAATSVASSHLAYGRDKATRASLAAIRDAIMGTPDKPGYMSDTGNLPVSLTDLFVNPFAPLGRTPNPLLVNFSPNTGLGWRGPYVLNINGSYTINNAAGFTSVYGNNNDPAVLDAWGNPIILQVPTSGIPADNQAFARLISAGPNGAIDTPPAFLDSNNKPYPVATVRGDDIVLFLNHSDSDP